MKIYISLLAAAALLSASDYILSPVTVSATKTTWENSETPASISVIDSEEIGSMGAATLSEVIGLDAGVSIMMKGNKKTAMIRGLGSEQTLILIDGRRLSKEPSQKFELDRIMLESIERIEVLKGPAGALYGADAIGGVINIITKSPDAFSASVQTRYGTYGGNALSKNIAFDVQSGRVEDFAFSLSGQYSDEEMQKHPEEARISIADDTTLRSFAFKGVYFANDAHRFELVADRGVDTSEYAYTSINGMGNTVYLYDEDENVRQNIAAIWKYRQGDAEGNLQLYSSTYEKESYMRNSANDQLYGSNAPFKIVDAQTYALDGIYSFAAGLHYLSVGGEYRTEEYKGTTIVTGEGTYTETREGKTLNASTAEERYYGLFVQDQFDLLDDLYMIAALRYDGSDNYDNEWTPSLGAHYTVVRTPEATTGVHASYTWGYRVPTTRDLYVKTAKKVGNPDLEAEHSRGYELGVEHVASAWRVKLTGFYTRVEDMITDRSQGTGLPKMFVNVDDVELKGVEVQSGYVPAPDWMVRVDYTYLQAKDDAGQQLESRPRHKGVGRIQHTYAPWGLESRVWIEYLKDVPTADRLSGETEKESYTNLNLSFQKSLGGNATLLLGVENLTDNEDPNLPLLGSFYYGGLKIRFAQ